MLTELQIGPSSDPCTVVHASFTPHKLVRAAFTASSKPLLRRGGRRRSKAITCVASPLNASNFSFNESNTSLTTIFETAQNPPESESTEQSTKERLENAQGNFEHVPSKSMTLEGNSSGFIIVDDDAYFSPSTQEMTVLEYASTATTREPASRLLQEEMSYDDGVPCSFMREARHDAIYVNSPSPLTLEDVEWDVERDNETLRLFSYNRFNLVLDSMFPHIAPHIVITPSEETWEDEYILWQNRVEPQSPHYLCVPPLDHSNCRMLVVERYPRQPHSETENGLLPYSATQDLPVTLNSFRLVPSPSIFKHPVTERSQEIRSSFSPNFKQSSTTSHEYKVLNDEMVTIQKALCRVTFFAASDAARVLRKRYDSQPNVLLDLEPAFTWTDPAEPILIANRRILGATILDSICPFLAPHIVINSPPPQPYHLTENNFTPYTQDAAFGDRLVVEAYYINIVNEAEEPGHDPYPSSTKIINNWEDLSSYGSSTVDLLEGVFNSRPGSPLPDTPVDDDDDRYFYFARNDDEESKEDDLAIRPDYRSIYGINPPIQADLHAEKFQTTSRPMFYIEEDDDELPSLDDW
ncbi:hypothetical protein H2248_006606 [Termitomyces sp. 'cryptogamus']|nr:hypothetical protein H2248_006606 [Termitomyces sp. 'cryptogamus']